MNRSWVAALWLGSTGLIVLAVVALFVTRGGQLGAGGSTTIVCDTDGGGCFPPDWEVPAIVASALAPIAFAIGLIGLLCAVLLRVVLGAVLENASAVPGHEPANRRVSRSAESFEQFKPPLSG